MKRWLWGGIAGLVAGGAVAIPMTILDWRLNPAGLFHDEDGTNWFVVMETMFSWFWGVALAAMLLTVAVWTLVKRYRGRPL